MKRLVIMVMVGVFSMLLTNTAKADLPPEPWHTASQDNCFAMQSDNYIYLYRKGVEKGAIPFLGWGSGTVRYSEGYLIGTWDNNNTVWLYHIQSETGCTRDVGMRCKNGSIEGQYAYVLCPTTVTRVNLDCSDHFAFPGGSFDEPLSIDRGSSDFVMATRDSGDKVGYYLPAQGSPSTYSTGITQLTQVRYHAGNSVAYYNGNDSILGSGIFFKDVPFINTPDSQLLVQLPANTRYMSINDTHIIASSFISEAYLIDIAAQSYLTLSMSEARANAISHDTVCVVDSGTTVVTRCYDFTGQERLEYSPTLVGAYSMTYIEPHVAPVCNNGLIEPGEVCDGSDFDGATCADQPGFTGGDLACNLSCAAFNTINCWTCGDGILNPGEQCDGTDFGTATCGDYSYASGDLTCNASCQIETTNCYTCGDGFIEGAEQCEAGNLNGGTCVSEDFVSGTLACGTDCMYDTSACSSCGDNNINQAEVCDGIDLNAACQTLGLGFTGGTLACNSTCDDYDTSSCTMCGNGVIENGEACDTNELDGETCSSMGYTGGMLACYANCTYNEQGCTGAPTAICGNGVVDLGEECDDGDRLNGDGCDEDCMNEPDPAFCGNGILDAGEECDGTDLNSVSCQSEGYDTGFVYCENSCLLNISSCGFANFQPASFNVIPGANPFPGSFTASQIVTYSEITGSRTKNCIPSMDGSDLLMTTTADGYCPIELDFGDLNKAKQGKVFAMIYKPTNSLDDANAVMRIKLNGDISFESGGHMRAQSWVNPAVTFGDNTLAETTEENISIRMEFLAVHPDPPEGTDANGRFLLIEISSGLGTYCSVSLPDECAVFPSGSVYILDLDKLIDSLGKLGRTPKSSGCSAAGRTSGNPIIPAFMMMIMLILAIRNRRQKQAANR